VLESNKTHTNYDHIKKLATLCALLTSKNKQPMSISKSEKELQTDGNIVDVSSINTQKQQCL
jgi:hypothetical protein